MKKNNDLLLKALNVISWIIFVGLCIEAGAFIFNFILSLFKPIASNNIYKGLNLSDLYNKHFSAYIGVMSFILVLAFLKAYLFYLVVKIIMKLNLVKPFNIEIAEIIQKISYEAIAIAVIGIIAHQYTNGLLKLGYETGNIDKYLGDTGTFLMMAAIIFVISQIFQKGIEIQNENDLTV